MATFQNDASFFDLIWKNLYVAAVGDILDELEIEAMDSLRPGDVAVHSTDYGGTNAPWGELMSTIAKRKGVAGCVCDSQIRDCVKIIRMGFPVYFSGIRPLDSSIILRPDHHPFTLFRRLYLLFLHELQVWLLQIMKQTSLPDLMPVFQ